MTKQKRSTSQRVPRIAASAAAAALLGLPTLGIAQSSAGNNGVTIYGLFDAAMRHASNVTANRDSLNTMEDGVFTGSRLGWRVREDLGDGMSAALTMESGFDPSSGVSLQATPAADFGQSQATTRFWGREIHLSLKSRDWGVTLGRQYTLAHVMTARFQPQGNPNNLALSVFSSHHIARQDNVLRADAKLGGVEFSVARTFGEVAGDNGANGTWAASAGYAGGPLYVGAYVQQLQNLGGTETRRIYGLGGSYKFSEVFTLYAAAMRRSNEVSPQINKVWTLGANFQLLPQVTLSLAYLDDQQSGSSALSGTRKVAYLSGSYAFSRRTDVYAVLDKNRVEGGYARPAFMGSKGDQSALTLGLRHRF